MVELGNTDPNVTRRRRERFGAPILVALFALAFMVFFTTNTVNTKLGDEEFYDGTLQNVDAYDRLYDKVLFDPALTNRVADLLGGVEIPVDEIKSVVQQIVPVSVLRDSVGLAIERLVEYLVETDVLQLAVDVTAYLQAIQQVVVEFVVSAVGLLPNQEVASYEDFVIGFQGVLQTLDAGQIPGSVPSFPIPAENVADVAAVIDEIVGIDPSSEEGLIVENAIAQGLVADAIKLVVGAILADTVSQSVDDLASGLDRGPGGTYLLGPSGPTVDRIKDQLTSVKRVVELSAAARIVAIVTGVAAMVALVLLFATVRLRALRWAGVALLSGGLLTFMVWLVARSVAVARIKDVAVVQTSGFPQSFSSIVQDAIDDVAAQLTTSLWTPAVIAAVIGAAVVAGAVALERRSVRANAAP